MKVKAQELNPVEHQKIKLRTFGVVELIQVVLHHETQTVRNLETWFTRTEASVTITLKNYGPLYPRGLEWQKTYRFDELVEVVDDAS